MCKHLIFLIELVNIYKHEEKKKIQEEYLSKIKKIKENAKEDKDKVIFCYYYVCEIEFLKN
jgi:hypothetical protein